MMDIFQIASIGMLDGRQRLEAVSENTASSTLPGYRRHVVTGSSFSALIGQPVAVTTAAASRTVDHVNLQPGAMQATGRSMDVAIDGNEGFFGLTDGVHTWLTRSGAFSLNADGVLVGEGGNRVVGAQGDIRLADSDVEIGADGRITHRGETVGALALFTPLDPASLLAASGTLLESPSGMQMVSAPRVRGGMLEASNTDPTREMLSVVGFSRQFEALSRVTQSYDEMLSQTIEKLGEV
jgi:flagellar basal-body rod protein FlgG